MLVWLQNHGLSPSKRASCCEHAASLLPIKDVSPLLCLPETSTHGIHNGGAACTFMLGREQVQEVR